MNHKPSLESQFLVTFLAFVGLLLGSALLMPQTGIQSSSNQQVSSQTAASDFSQLNNAGKLKYIQDIILRQGDAQTTTEDYFAAAKGALDSNILPSPPQPFTSPFQLLACDTPTSILNTNQFSSLPGFGSPALPGSVPEPTPTLPRTSPSEFYLFSGSRERQTSPQIPGSMAVWHLGVPEMGVPTWVSVPPDSRVARQTVGRWSVSDRFAVTVIDNPAQIYLQLRYTGLDGVFGSGDDPTPRTIFNLSPPFAFPTSAFFDVSGNYLVFMLRLASAPPPGVPQTWYIVRVLLRPDGTPLAIDSPSIQSPQWPQLPNANYYFKKIRIAATGAIVMQMDDTTQQGHSFLYEWSPGLDGIPSADDRLATIWNHPTDWVDDFAFSDSGRFIAFSTVYWPNRGIPVKLKYMDDPDGLPLSGDETGPLDITPVASQPNPNFRHFFDVQVGDPIPSSSALPRGSMVRVQALYSDNSIGLDYETLYFMEDGGNGYLGDSDDVIKTFSYTRGASEAYLAPNRNNSILINRISNLPATVNGFRWCY